MKTLLVIATHPELADALRAGLNPQRYRLVHRLGVEDAEPLLGAGMVDLCFLDAAGSVEGLWAVEKLRRRLPSCPLIVFASGRAWDWEEEAYLHGVAHVLTKPARPRLVNALLERLWSAPATSPAPLHPSTVPRPPVSAIEAGPAARGTAETLRVLRDFSSILTHSLHSEALLRQFLLLLREILGVNRAAVFLRQPVAPFGGAAAGEARRLRSACAIGLPAGLLEHFELSFETGIGGCLLRQGRIVRADGPEARQDVEMQKEFDLLGSQVAVPILDRENLVGIATFDGRVTGEPLSNGELELIFHLLEQLGLAVKNIWLHDQLSANHAMLAEILRELSSACVLVSRDLAVLHANKAARQLFGKSRRTEGLDFSDLPQALGSKVYQVLQTGTGVATFKHAPEDAPQSVYHVSVVPFTRAGEAAPGAALLVVEDHTQAEQFKRLEIEAANLRLIRTMAERMAHEIGNAIVPLAAHQQLLAEKFRDAEFRASLDLSMSESVKRIARLTSQMRYLARDAVLAQEAVPLAQLIEESFKEARKHQPSKTAKLEFEDSKPPIVVSGDQTALRHAVSEVMLNALQASPATAKVEVKVQTDSEGNGHNWVHIDIADSGSGFTPEAAQKAPAPFFTTRTVGLGLGLTVSRKIIETHQGRISFASNKPGQPAVVRISLPLKPAAHN
jgi:signal transduction histidine kinase/DNA-binding NarL/FixJ family response regulator